MKISKKILFITFFIICISANLVYARTGKVKIEAARVRQEANTTSNVITIIYKGDEVEILEESGDWYKIKYKDDTGFVKKDFLTENKEDTKNNTIGATNNNQTNTTSQSANKNQTNTASQATNKNQTNVASQATNTSKDNTVSQTTNTTQDNTSVQSTPEVPADESTVIIKSETHAKLLPNFSSNNIVKFEASKQVKKLTELSNWVQVTDNENTGWILKNKIQAGAIVSNETIDKPENTTVQNTSNTVSNTSKTNTVTNTVSNTVSNTTNTTANNTTTATNTTTSSNAGSKKAVITVETAKVRKAATTNSDAIGFLDYGDEVTILEQEGEWYKISFKDITGYVKNTLLKVSDNSVSSRSLAEERNEKTISETTTSNELSVADYAKQYLGCSYVVGGKDPSTGFDCSGFTRYVYSHFGYSLGSTAASQTNIGTEVSRDNLVSGDLLLFLNEEKTGIGHTGVYIGSGEFVHAANPKRGVVIDNLNTNSYYNERFVTARRIVN